MPSQDDQEFLEAQAADQQQKDLEAESELQHEEGWSTTQQTQPPELTRWQLSADDVLEFIEHELRGEILDNSGQNPKWTAAGQPILNERGVRTVVGILRHHVNKILFLSNLDDQQIYDIMYNLSNNLTQILFNNGDDFDINWARGHQNTIVDNVCDLVFVSLRQALDQGGRKFFSSSTKVLHRIDESPAHEKSKKFGLF